MSSFEKEDEKSKYAVVPKSVNEGKVVKLSQKTLTTNKLVRKILPEENYVSGLDKIIKRDYFPELKKMKVQQEYLNAVKNKDVTKVRELQIKYCTGSVRTERSVSSFRTPGTSMTTIDDLDDADIAGPSTPAPETPGPSEKKDNEWIHDNIPFSNEEGDNDAIARKRKRKENISLTQYLNKYTSEDNASFEELAKVTREKEEAKRMWLYKAEEEHNKNKIVQKEIAAEADVQLALKNASDAEDSRPYAVDNWKYTAWNTVLFNPDGVALTPGEASVAAKKQQVEINRKATRFPSEMKQKPSNETIQRAAANHLLNNYGKVDVHGREITAAQQDGMLKLLATPDPNPEVMDSPLMTWGEIDGTPFRLDQPDFDGTPVSERAPTFKIPEVPFREKVAQSLQDSVAEKYRDKRNVAMKAAEGAHPKTPGIATSKILSNKLSQLSPAAQKLATKKLGMKCRSKAFNKTPFSSSRYSKTIRSDWSNSSSGTPRTPGTSWSQGGSTPVESMIRRRNEPATPDGSEEKRAKAGDFF